LKDKPEGGVEKGHGPQRAGEVHDRREGRRL
jgi:hypothetical protein